MQECCRSHRRRCGLLRSGGGARGAHRRRPSSLYRRFCRLAALLAPLLSTVHLRGGGNESRAQVGRERERLSGREREREKGREKAHTNIHTANLRGRTENDWSHVSLHVTLQTMDVKHRSANTENENTLLWVQKACVGRTERVTDRECLCMCASESLRQEHAV